MNAAETNNATSSDKTSDSAPHAAKEREEVAFLTDEAEAAKAAILQVLDDLKADLQSATDVHAWAQIHPWAVVGLAAAAGFAAATAVTPSTHAERRPPRAETPYEPPPAKPPSSLASSWSWLLVPLVDLIKNTAERMVGAAIEAGKPPSPSAHGNGKVVSPVSAGHESSQ